MVSQFMRDEIARDVLRMHNPEDLAGKDCEVILHLFVEHSYSETYAAFMAQVHKSDWISLCDFVQQKALRILSIIDQWTAVS